MKQQTADDLKQVLGSRALPWVAIALGVALMLPSVTTGFAADDHVHRVLLLDDKHVEGFDSAPWDLFVFGSGDPDHRAQLMEHGIFSWWTAKQQKVRFLRPLASITHVVDYALWPDEPALHHAHSILWFLLLLLVIRKVFRRFHTSWIAAIALVLFALDDAHGPAVGYIANRNVIIAAVFGFAALLAHDRWRRDGWRPGRWAGPLLLAGGLLAGEAALAIMAYLGSHALFFEKGRLWRRFAPLWPYLAVCAVWAVGYKLGGFGASGSGIYVDPASDPGTFAAQAAEHIPVLMLAQFAIPFSDFWFTYPPDVARGIVIMGLLVLLNGFYLMWPLLKGDAALRMWALGALGACVPVAATVPFDRLLLFVGVGAMGQLAALFASRVDRTPVAHVGKSWQLSASINCALLVLIHVVVAPVLLPFRSMDMQTAEAGVQIFDMALPETEELRDQTVVTLTAPLDGMMFYTPFLREERGAPRPVRMRLLASGLAEVQVTRVDAHTLRVRPGEGYLAMMLETVLRGPGYPFEVGERVELSDMVATVTEVLPDGRAAEAEFRFVRALEDPHYQWMTFKADGFEPYVPPAVGQTHTVPAADVEAIVERYF